MRLASPVYSGFSWSWGGWRGWVMSGPLCFRTIPVNSEPGEGGTFSFQALCNFTRKGTWGNQLPNYPVGTDVDVALSPPGLPPHPISSLLIRKTQQKFFPTAFLHVIHQGTCQKDHEGQPWECQGNRPYGALWPAVEGILGLAPIVWWQKG